MNGARRAQSNGVRSRAWPSGAEGAQVTVRSQCARMRGTSFDKPDGLENARDQEPIDDKSADPKIRHRNDGHGAVRFVPRSVLAFDGRLADFFPIV